ncbi:hypothetical protein CALCODRAFT_151039 [Calocera cornea HHB12733]|uniref:Enhancer of polycomb-like protein n=1 Tax=Calocera cornea HHB12733 TaxID=1353952 RepID=A0A165I4X4_9BASI|nr:hypothetical protein CALCODRAFT_151039 [Calocera cornea HHB12733]
MLSPSVASQSLPSGKGHPAPRAVGQRIRVTNRSRLRLFYGSLDADTVILDEDGSGNGFATAGVDAEDAKEHHLQVVLSLQSLEGSWSSVKEEEGEKDHKDEKDASTKEGDRRAFIPVPDAAGIVADPDYERLYSAEAPWKDSTEYIRFSDTIDETLASGLRDGYTYDVDEEDDYWMERHEQDPDGLGSQTPGSRTSRAKAKSKEVDFPAVSIQKPEFELAMGMMEMFCDSLRPTLHTDLSKIPVLADLEENFVHELEEEYFATYEVPPTVPKSERLWSLVRTLYPFWRDRKLARGGHRIMPQLNTDETLDDDFFVCFRRRDPKAIRRTRRSDITHNERLARLRMDFEELEDIARSTLLREQKKVEQVLAEQTLYEARKRFNHIARRPEVTPHPDDEKLLIPNYQEPKLLVQLSSKRTHRLDENVPKDLQRQKTVDRREIVTEETRQAYRKRKLEDENYESQLDVRDFPYPYTSFFDSSTQILAQPKIKRTGPFEFQWIPHQIQTEELPPPPRTFAEQGTNVGFRVRRGRGGTVRCDRLLPRNGRRRLAEPQGLFTKKPFAFEQDIEADHDSRQDDSDIDSPPALSVDSDATLTSSDSDTAKETFRKYFLGTEHVSSDPDLENQGIQVVDDYDVRFSTNRASLHDPGKANPLHLDNGYLLAAHMYVRETRAKEVKVPLWPSAKPTVAPVRISGLKVTIPPTQPAALGLHSIKTNLSLQLSGQPQTVSLTDPRSAIAQHALHGGGHPTPEEDLPANASTLFARPIQPPATLHGEPNMAKPIASALPHPPSANPDNPSPSRAQEFSAAQMQQPNPSAMYGPAPNGLGLQLGPTDLKLSSAVPSPGAGYPAHPQPYAAPYNPSHPGPPLRADSTRSPVNQRGLQSGMPAMPAHHAMPMHNYPMYHAGATAATTAQFYAQAMNGLGFGPGQAPQGPAIYDTPEYRQYYAQAWIYHQMNQGQPGPTGSPYPHPPGPGDAPQHFMQGGFRANPVDPRGFGQFPQPNLNLRIPQARQKSGNGPASAASLRVSTPDRHATPGQVLSQAPTYPTPLTRPPSEPRDLESSPSGRRQSSDLSSDNGVSSPLNPSPLPTTPVSQPAVSQGKSPVD